MADSAKRKLKAAEKKSKKRKSKGEVSASKKKKKNDSEAALKSAQDKHAKLRAGSKPIFVQPENLADDCLLKDYQLVGVRWLASLFENGVSGILADGKKRFGTFATFATYDPSNTRFCLVSQKWVLEKRYK